MAERLIAGTVFANARDHGSQGEMAAGIFQAGLYMPPRPMSA